MNVVELANELSTLVTNTSSVLHWKLELLDPIAGTVIESKQHQEILGNRRGLYVFASYGDGMVLYIGKSESRPIWQELDNYLNNEQEAQRLDRIQRDKGIRFPYCTLTLRRGQKGDWIQQIRQAQFKVVCLSIDPPNLVGLLERYALIWCRERDGQLPPINKVL